jgi:ElaB/YqjD/DUF883 family membrane-anchored ribosome-binding protein
MVDQTNDELNPYPVRASVVALEHNIPEPARTSTFTLESSDEPGAIQNEIAQTRRQLGQTIEQIQDRLSPERLREQAKESIREATIGKVEEMTYKAGQEVKSWRAKLTQTVRENPVPAALIGIGLGWLILSDNNGRTYEEEHDRRSNIYRQYGSGYEGYSDSRGAEALREGREWAREKGQEAKEVISSTAEKAQDYAASVTESIQESASDMLEQGERQAKELGNQVRETVAETQEQIRERAAHLETRAQQGLRKTKYTFIETMEENPLAIGAAVLALGLLVGTALPRTASEDRWLGEKRDHLVDEVKERVQETAHKVQNVVHEVQEAAMETARDEVEKQNFYTPTTTPTTSKSPDWAENNPAATDDNRVSGMQQRP